MKSQARRTAVLWLLALALVIGIWLASILGNTAQNDLRQIATLLQQQQVMRTATATHNLHIEPDNPDSR